MRVWSLPETPETEATRTWIAAESAKGRWVKDAQGNWSSNTPYKEPTRDEWLAAGVAAELLDSPTDDAKLSLAESAGDINWEDENDPRAIQFEKELKAYGETHPDVGRDFLNEKREYRCEPITIPMRLSLIAAGYDPNKDPEVFEPIKILTGVRVASRASAIAAIGVPTSNLVTTRGDMIKPKLIKWLWPSRIPFGKLSVFAGDPDQGKSLVTMYMVSQLTTGRQLYGSDINLDPCEVLILAGEDEADDTIIPRLKVGGADLTKVHIVDSIVVKDGAGKTVSEREAQLDTDIQAIETVLQTNPDIRLVIVDPLSNYLGRANMNREQEVRQVLVPLKNLAARMNVAIISVMHLNKTSDASAIHRIGGAVAFTGVARACWLFMADPEDKNKHMMLRIKGNIAKRVGGLTYIIEAKNIVIEGSSESLPYVNWIGETDQVASDVMIGGAPVGRPSEKVKGAKEWLAAFLSNGGELASDIRRTASKAGYSWATIRRAKDDLSVMSLKQERLWYWMLPEKGTTIIEENREPISLD
jgi:putative DNA primase/helicase